MKFLADTQLTKKLADYLNKKVLDSLYTSHYQTVIVQLMSYKPKKC